MQEEGSTSRMRKKLMAREAMAYMKEYNQRPEVKAHRKEYYQRPEVKARARTYSYLGSEFDSIRNEEYEKNRKANMSWEEAHEEARRSARKKIKS